MSLALFLSKTRFHCVPPLKYASCFQSRTTRLYTPLCRSVHPSIHPSIHSSIGLSITLYVSVFMGFLGMLLLPKCSPDLKYGPWPPDATGVALYLAFLVADWLLYYATKKKAAPHFEWKEKKNKSLEHFFVKVILKIFKFSFILDQSQICISNG